MLAPSVPYAHRKDLEVNQLGSCSRCGAKDVVFVKYVFYLKPIKFVVLPLDLNIVFLGP